MTAMTLLHFYVRCGIMAPQKRRRRTFSERLWWRR